MGFFAKLKEFLGLEKEKKLLKTKVRCKQCAAEIDSVFRKNYDFQPTYKDQTYEYSINKELVCPNCYDSIDLYLELDENLTVLAAEITGGEIINKNAE